MSKSGPFLPYLSTLVSAAEKFMHFSPSVEAFPHGKMGEYHEEGV
jgi:hypothetical protein